MAGLAPQQIAAAAVIMQRCPTLVAVEDALDALASSFSGLERESLLLKVAAVAQLLGGPSYPALHLAAHAAATLVTRPWDYDTVERLAAVPQPAPAQRRIAFASRFAHFFLDPRRFPAIDGHVLRGLAAVAPPRLAMATPYATIAERIELQRAGHSPQPPLRAVQHTLGLLGQALALGAPGNRPVPRIHDEVRTALAERSLCEALLGAR